MKKYIRPKKWTESEDQILKEILLDPDITSSEQFQSLASSITGRTEGACYSRASRRFNNLLKDFVKTNKEKIEKEGEISEKERGELIESAKKVIEDAKKGRRVISLQKRTLQIESLKGRFKEDLTQKDLSKEVYKTLTEMKNTVDVLIEDKTRLLSQTERQENTIKSLSSKLDVVTMERNQMIQELNSIHQVLSTIKTAPIEDSKTTSLIPFFKGGM